MTMTKITGTELATIQSTEFRSSLDPRSFEQAMQFSETVAKTGICGVRTKEEVFIRIAAGRELGLSAMQSLRQVYVIDGRPALDASLVVGLCLSSPLCEYFDLVESGPDKATWKAKRVGRPEQSYTWTAKDSERAGLASRGTHTKYPSAMNRARAATSLARIVFPDVLGGFSSREEAESGELPHDPNELVGEVVHAATDSPARNFEAEADILKERIASHPEGDEKKSLVAYLKIWTKEAPAEIVKPVKDFYGMVYAANGTAKAEETQP